MQLPGAISYADAGLATRNYLHEGENVRTSLTGSTCKFRVTRTKPQCGDSARCALTQWWSPSHTPSPSVAPTRIGLGQFGEGPRQGASAEQLEPCGGDHEAHSAVPTRTATTRKASEKWQLNWTAPLKADAVECECDGRSMADGGLRPELASLGCNAGRVTSGPMESFRSSVGATDRGDLSADATEDVGQHPFDKNIR